MRHSDFILLVYYPNYQLMEVDEMIKQFILSCESTVDVPYSYMNERNIPVLFYSYSIDGQNYEDNMGRDPYALQRFYGFLDAGKIPTTSQLNGYQYYAFFEELLKKGDVLHIAFGSGMTKAVNNAFIAADMIRSKYPNRKITVIDSLCSSSGYGLLVDGAADLRDNGCTIEETEQWVIANRRKVHHQFYSTDLQYYRHSGRISGTAATVGAVLNICPIMRLDDKGRIVAYHKVRGQKNAIRETIHMMESHAQDGINYSGKCWICHSNCIESAIKTKSTVKEHFPKINEDIRIFDIGTIIASHCGPETVAVFFFGDER